MFLLKGYAGTGKTTLMGALIRWLHTVNRKTVLLAPTGRAAKVLARHSGFPASTIHRRIYAVKEGDNGRLITTLVDNKSERTFFICDEASMIGLHDGASNRSLIEDLLSYVYSGSRCRLIFIGDEAQLPPVSHDFSPALDPEYMRKICSGPIYSALLKEVVRQSAESCILENATQIRNDLLSEQMRIALRVDPDRGVHLTDGYELEDELSAAFLGKDEEDAIVICRSNKDAYAFNQQIRTRLLDRDEEVAPGDRMMIVKNNYFWKIPGKKGHFLANGDMFYIERILDRVSFGPFNFVEATVCLPDDDTSLDLILMCNSLAYEGPSIPGKELFRLREHMIESGVLDPGEAREKFFQNPYFNALQIKYAYAITCHKSQGGQWPVVFIHQGYLNDEMLNVSLLRWLYTALTRATDHVRLVGFAPQFLVESKD